MMALATDSGITVAWVAVKVLPVVIAAKLVMVVVVPLVAVVTSLSSSTAYMFWACGAYPICPAVLCNCWDRRHRVYAAAMLLLRAGYVFGVMTSQSLNSFKGKISIALITWQHC